MRETVRIRVAEAADVEAILRVERGCSEAPQWGDAIWRGLMDENEVGLRGVLVAEGASGVAGFIVVGGVMGVAEIESVAVASGARGQGVGRALCRAAMRQAAERGAVRMELEVRASSGSARRMYAGLGFEEQGVRQGYYQGPVEDAVLMVRPLTGQ